MDTSSRKYLIQCLARWYITHFKNRAARQASLKRWEKRHGKKSADWLKREIKRQWQEKK